METLPSIKPIFVLTKQDCLDFDRNSVSQKLGVTPSMTEAPVYSRGKLYGTGSIQELQNELQGITILPADTPPYSMLKHAYWSIELPQISSLSLDDPLNQLEKILWGRESSVYHVCEEYNLSASLVIRVFAESNNMPELTLPKTSIQFWASMNASIGFDFYLD